MKKLFSTILILGFLLSGNAYAETKVIDKFSYKVKKETRFTVYTLCIDGYKFITTQDIEYVGIGNSNSISTSVGTIQFMIAENGKMIPAKCN
tara:strand:+ start:61 stop:336 length:276 start_codon:yes stop_codon:yes gene_type:complete